MNDLEKIFSWDLIEKNKENASELFSFLEILYPKLYHFINIASKAKVGLFLTDGTGMVIYINKMYEEMTGVSYDEIVGKDVRNLIFNGEIYKSTSITTIERKAPITAELFFESTKRLITISTTPIFDKNGDVIYVIGSMSDTTELIHIRESFLEMKNSPFNRESIEQELQNSLKNEKFQIIAHDIKMLRVLQYAKKVALSNSIVLIGGQTGTGKEEMAHYIHRNSSRKDKPIIAINCSAIPVTLIESELFGYEGGAFTGAKAHGHKGLFEQANGGTLFLDEVAELPLEIQSKLLRVLQEQVIIRIGGTTPIPVDVRIIAATNKNLAEMVDSKKFREDLYYRLNVVPIYIPPLKERKNDIVPLALYFLKNFSERYNKKLNFSSDALLAMEEYSWPGNIRELRNLIERSAITIEGNIITANLLFEQSTISSDSTENMWQTNLSEKLERIEYNYIRDYYEHYKSIRKAAEALGMDRSTFNRKKLYYEKKWKNQ